MSSHEKKPSSYDPCPLCGKPKRKKNKRCGSCWGYGNGRAEHSCGYVKVWAPGHPMAYADGYALEHRKVLHDAGIPLPAGSHVHHINGDKRDNRIENLRVLLPGEHTDEHLPIGGRVINQYGVFTRYRPSNNEGRAPSQRRSVIA